MRIEMLTNNPSILCPLKVGGSAGVSLSCHWTRGRVHPGQVSSLSQGLKVNQTVAILMLYSVMFPVQTSVALIKQDRDSCNTSTFSPNSSVVVI